MVLKSPTLAAPRHSFNTALKMLTPIRLRGSPLNLNVLSGNASRTLFSVFLKLFVLFQDGKKSVEIRLQPQ